MSVQLGLRSSMRSHPAPTKGDAEKSHTSSACFQSLGRFRTRLKGYVALRLAASELIENHVHNSGGKQNLRVWNRHRNLRPDRTIE